MSRKRASSFEDNGDESQEYQQKRMRQDVPRQDIVRKHSAMTDQEEDEMGTIIIHQRRRLDSFNGGTTRFAQLTIRDNNQSPVEEIRTNTNEVMARPELQQHSETFDIYLYQYQFSNSMIALSYIWLSRPDTPFEYVHYNGKVRQMYQVVNPIATQESRTFTAALSESDISEHQLHLHECGRSGHRPVSYETIRGPRRFMFEESQQIWHLEGMITGYVNFECFIHRWFQRLRSSQDLLFHRQWEGSQRIESTPLFEGRIEHVANEWRQQKPKIEVDCFNCEQQIVQFFPIAGLTTMLFGPGFVSVASDRWLLDRHTECKYRYIITPYTIYNWYQKYDQLLSSQE